MNITKVYATAYDFFYIKACSVCDMPDREDIMKIFESIHDLISSYDEGLRSSSEVHKHVRKCFKMLYKYIGDGEEKETSYHGEQEVEKWILKEEVYQQYEYMIQEVEEELHAACVEYHSLPNRLLHYEPYCAFMETYTMCMQYRHKPVHPTETEEQYLYLVVDEDMWTEACEKMKIKSNVDEAYLIDQLKTNTTLKDAVIKLAIHYRLNLLEYRRYVSVEGVYHALNDILFKLQSEYILITHQQMDQKANRYLEFELQKYDKHTPTQEIVNNNKIYKSRDDKKKFMVDLISSVHALCRHPSRRLQTEEFRNVMHLIYEKVLRKQNNVTSLNYFLDEQTTTEVQYSLNESYGVFLKCMNYFDLKLQSAVIFLNTVMNRLDDGKEWKVVIRSGCWWMEGRDGTMQQITVENPMLEVAYTSENEKYSFVTSFVKMLERMCQHQYEIPSEKNIHMSPQFKQFHDNVREIEKNPKNLVMLCDQTCENWSRIEPDVTKIKNWATVPPDIANLLDIGQSIPILWCLSHDLQKKDPFVWNIEFKFRNWHIRTEYIDKRNALLNQLHALCM
jgi:hypothetical protein